MTRDAQALALTVEVDDRTIPDAAERWNLAIGVQQAFDTRPQHGRWRVLIYGDSGGHSDRYVFDFYLNHSPEIRGGLKQSIAELHIGLGGPGAASEKFIAQVRRGVELWLSEHGTA